MSRETVKGLYAREGQYVTMRILKIQNARSINDDNKSVY